MANDSMEREGEAAGGRSMQGLIVCVCVSVVRAPGRKATYVLFTVHTDDDEDDDNDDT